MCRSCAVLLSCVVALVFLFVLPAAASSDLLESAHHYLPGKRISSAVAEDFNQDGHLDLAVLEWTEDHPGLWILSGDGSGEFDETTYTVLGVRPRHLSTGDLNEDGLVDLVIADSGTHPDYEGKVILLTGRGDGTFNPFAIHLNGRKVGFTAIADIDGDSHVDLAVTITDEDDLVLLLGDGNGTFNQAPPVRAYPNPRWVDFSDVDGDGSTDMVTAGGNYDPFTSWSEGFVLIFHGNGDGTFAPAMGLGENDFRPSAAIGDLDGDGNPDIASVVPSNPHYNHGMLELYFGHGNGSFHTPVEIPLTFAPQSIDIADTNNDGNPDLLVGGRYAMTVFLGDGSGGFTDNGRTRPPAYWGTALADLDADGRLDLVTPWPWNGLAVHRGRGDGGFFGPARHEWGRENYDVVPEDFNGDGITDYLVGFRLYDYVYQYPEQPDLRIAVHLGQPDGSYVTSYEDDRSYNEVYPREMATGLIDDDQIPDMAVIWSNTIYTYLGNGDGTFDTLFSYPDISGSNGFALERIDDDPWPDLVAIPQNGNDVFIYRGNGDGTFEAPYTITAGIELRGMVVSDLDLDGDLDLALTDALQTGIPHMIHVLLNDGTGAFEAEPMLDGGYWPTGITAGDLDGDGDIDLAVANLGPNDENGFVGVYRNIGGWYIGETIPVDLSPDQIACSDLDGDGDHDLVAGSDSEHLVLLESLGGGTFADPVSLNGVCESPLRFYDVNGDSDDDLVMTGQDHVWIFPNPLLGRLIGAGPGPAPGNPAQVRIFDAERNGVLLSEWKPYPAVGYGVNVALGELDGQPGIDVLTGPGPGPGLGPNVRGFTTDGTPLTNINFLAYGTHSYGVNIAMGDVLANGTNEIITGAGPGTTLGPHVRGWVVHPDGPVTPLPGISFFAYGTPKWGVNVATGDINGDGDDEIITGAGPGAVYGPHVRAWDIDAGGTATPLPQVSFLAYGTNKHGVNVTAGDIDGDGIAEIVTGAGPGPIFGPHVRGWNWDGTGPVTPVPGVSFFAYTTANWGVNVSCGDLDGDGIDEILTGPGPAYSFGPHVAGWNYDGNELTAMDLVDFRAWPMGSVNHGVKVSGVIRGNP